MAGLGESRPNEQTNIDNIDFNRNKKNIQRTKNTNKKEDVYKQWQNGKRVHDIIVGREGMMVRDRSGHLRPYPWRLAQP